jgi:type IV pilus assembly protein PilM
MAAKLPVWGIDVGQSALRAMRLQQAAEQFEILDLVVIEHEQILSAPDVDANALIQAALQSLLSRHDLRREPVVVSVPGQQTLARFTKLPPVEPKKIPDIVNFEAQQQIPFDMDEVVWDYEIFSAPDSPDVEVGIIAIRKELIRAHLAHFLDLGIEPIAVQAAPLATYNALRVDGRFGDETTLLLNIGAVSTDLIVVEGHSLWSRPVPIGGNTFTEALMQAFKLSFQKAEALKRQAASSKYARQIFQAMRSVFADLVSEVQRSVGFYASTHRQSQIKRVLGMGNAFALPGLQKFLQQNLQIPVEKFAGFQRVAKTPVLESPQYAEQVLSLAVSFGAAAQGLGAAPVRASLLPPEISRRITWRKKANAFAAAAACLALAAGSVWLGNIMAARALAARFGSVTAPNPRPVAAVEQAAQILAAPPSPDNTPPLEVAVTVLGAIEKLKAEFDKLPKIADQAEKLNLIARLPEANVVIPQIVDAIHRVFEDSLNPELRAVQTVEDYLELAQRVSRPERSELWIERLRMKYDRRDAAAAFATRARMRADDSEEEGTGAGWGIILEGRTTRDQPALWLGDLARRIEQAGRNRDRQFWIERAELRNLQLGPPEIDRLRRSPTRQPIDTGRAPPGAGRDERSGREPDRTPQRAERPPSGEAAPLRDQFRDLAPQPGIDPVTGESTMQDTSFTIEIIVRKGRVPDRVLQGESPAPTSPAEGTTPPRRADERD